jgi:hypothetical protein
LNPTIDPRDAEVLTLVGQIDHLGIVVLLALSRNFPEPVKLARLAQMTKSRDVRKTLQPILNSCEICGYATRTGSGNSESWHLTDIGIQAIISLVASITASTDRLPSRSRPASPTTLALPGLEEGAQQAALPPPLMFAGENLSAPSRSSSSSILIDQLDRSIDPEEEEENDAEKISAEKSEAERQAAVKTWCDLNAITGQKRSDVLADSWCTLERLSAWLSEMQHRGEHGLIKFRNKYGPLNYAITCCLHHDEPVNSYTSGWNKLLASRRSAQDDEPDERDEEEPEATLPAEEPAPPAVIVEDAEKISAPPPPEPPAPVVMAEPIAPMPFVPEWKRQQLLDAELDERMRQRRIENDRRRKAGLNEL